MSLSAGRSRRLSRDLRHLTSNGFPQLLQTELKLLLREPMMIFWALVFPVGLLVVLGAASGKPIKALGGLRLIEVEAPVEMMFSVTMLALSALPATLASYREKGYLRRLSTTPIGAWRLLAAQIAIVIGISAAVVTLQLIIAVTAYHVPFPSDFAAFVLSMLLTMGAMTAIGMLIAALARTPRIAGAAGGLLFFPLMFFAGLWVPQAEMGTTLRDISQYTPLGAATAAVQNSIAGQWAGTTHLIVLAVYAVVGIRLAVRFFRWDS